MTRMLFHITTGTQNPTRAALGLLVALSPPDKLVELIDGSDKVVVY